MNKYNGQPFELNDKQVLKIARKLPALNEQILVNGRPARCIGHPTPFEPGGVGIFAFERAKRTKK